MRARGCWFAGVALMSFAVGVSAGCGDDASNAASGPTSSAQSGAGGGASSAAAGGVITTSGSGGALTLDTCETTIAEDVPDFYKKYFRCVDIEMQGGNVVIRGDDLPPHESAYYNPRHPNYVDFDTSGGNMKIVQAEIAAQNMVVTIASDPTPKSGLIIDGSLLDGTLMTSNEEYSAGAAGVALNGVAFFSGAAGMNMTIADEAATFDAYLAHPAMDEYHYHGQSPGPLEVLAKLGVITDADTTPGAAQVELYAVMCDGTLVLGCTELDGSAPATADMDAQGGHVHDITDGADTFFAGRYHTHVCPGTAADYSPEIQYYTSCP